MLAGIRRRSTQHQGFEQRTQAIRKASRACLPGPNVATLATKALDGALKLLAMRRVHACWVLIVYRNVAF